MLLLQRIEDSKIPERLYRDEPAGDNATDTPQCRLPPAFTARSRLLVGRSFLR